MGLIVDTSVFIAWERRGQAIDFTQWQDHGDAAISVITVSELLVGVHRADNETRRQRRSTFVESILSQIPALDITVDVSRTHAELFATLMNQGQMIGAHDLLIAATARYYDYAVLTINIAEFNRIPGLEVLELPA